jgi:tetrahydromethanopterin S-methyltransferase subunit C
MTISLREPSCSGNGTVAIEFLLKQMKLQSTNFNSSIGPNVTTTFTFTTQLGSAQQTDVGLFISGISS